MAALAAREVAAALASSCDGRPGCRMRQVLLLREMLTVGAALDMDGALHGKACID